MVLPARWFLVESLGYVAHPWLGQENLVRRQLSIDVNFRGTDVSELRDAAGPKANDVYVVPEAFEIVTDHGLFAADR